MDLPVPPVSVLKSIIQLKWSEVERKLYPIMGAAILADLEVSSSTDLDDYASTLMEDEQKWSELLMSLRAHAWYMADGRNPASIKKYMQQATFVHEHLIPHLLFNYGYSALGKKRADALWAAAVLKDTSRRTALINQDPMYQRMTVETKTRLPKPEPGTHIGVSLSDDSKKMTVISTVPSGSEEPSGVAAGPHFHTVVVVNPRST